VKHVQANVERVELDETGAIAAVHTRERGSLSAELYIDCTGFRGALIGGALGSQWRPLNDTLFVDRALAVQVPYPRPDSPLPSYTISTAHEAGWTWDIGLQQRRGVGYVYSSRYTDDARAEQVLRNYIGPQAETLTPRLLKLNVGYRDVQWVKNCVAIGLSAGFLEPLESSGIGLIETAAYLVTHLFPFDGRFEPAAKLFNELMRGRFERIVDFLKLHYALTKRTDTPFWMDNAKPETMSESLRDKLDMWRCRPPHRLDFVADLEMYQVASWQFVLYGMEFETRMQAARAGLDREQEARREFMMLRQLSQHAMADLPDHRQLVQQLCERAARKAELAAA
jgi:tryptophan halogenase